MTQIITTLNSVYEIDPDTKRFRRTWGRNPPRRTDLVDNTWYPYEVVYPYINALVIVLTDGEPLITSQILCSNPRGTW